MQFVTKAIPINSIIISNRTCLIGYSGFILREWYLIALDWT